MRKPSAQLHALFAFTVSAAFINGAPASASDGAKLTAAPPEGFALKERAGAWKYPRWIEFRADLPKTATGKIQRFKLRAEDQT